MGLVNAPGIVTNGLTFAYDVNNYKSYIGPAIANQSSFLNQVGTGVSNGYSSTSSVAVENIPTLGTTTVNYNVIQNNYPAVSANCCPSLFAYSNGFAALPNTLYTYAIVYKCDSGYTNPNYMYRYEYTSNGGTLTIEQGVHNDANRVHLGNDWYWAWATFTTQATTNWFGYMGAFYYRYSTTLDRLAVPKVLITPGNYTALHPTYWPAVNNSISNTTNIKTLTSSTPITATSLTYASNGSFSFDGNASYMQTTSNCGITGSITLSAWIKPSYAGQTGPHSTVIATDTDYPYGAKLMNYKNTARYGIWLGFGGTDNYEAFVSADINDNTNKMLTATWEQSTGVANIYLNGILQSSISTGKTIPVVLSTGRITLGTDYFSIGSANKNKFLGNIYSGSIYNRALSATEVLQNFNALRGRFGL